MSRKTNARIEDAHADVEEFKALREYNEFLQKQLSEKEQRFVEQTEQCFFMRSRKKVWKMEKKEVL